MNNKIASLLLYTLLLAACSSQKPLSVNTTRATVVTNQSKDRIDKALKYLVEADSIAGVSAMVFEKGEEVYFNAFGYADKEAQKVMDRNTLVRIYSMTKPITGVALMTLYEKGAFQLDEPLSKYAPEFANLQVYKGVDASGKLILEPARRPITIRDITRHTAGFAPGTSLPGLAELVQKADVMNPANTLTEMAKKLAALPLQFHPGDQWAYGPSVDVQAHLVELLAGVSFEKYIKKKILQPLAMNQTRYVVPGIDRSRFAAMYRKGEDGQLVKVPDTDQSFNIKDWPLKPGGFGLTATIDDYMKFARMLLNMGSLNGTTILQPQTVQLMATNHLSDTINQRMWLPSKGQVGFGIDFAVRLRKPGSSNENNGTVGEFFWDGAASTLFWVDPANDLAAVLFVQKMPFFGQLHKAFRDAVYGPVNP